MTIRSLMGMPQKFGEATRAALASAPVPAKDDVETEAPDAVGPFLVRDSEAQTPTMIRISPSPAPTPTRKISLRVGFLCPRAFSASDESPLLATTCARASRPELGIASLPARLL